MILAGQRKGYRRTRIRRSVLFLGFSARTEGRFEGWKVGRLEGKVKVVGDGGSWEQRGGETGQASHEWLGRERGKERPSLATVPARTRAVEARRRGAR